MSERTESIYRIATTRLSYVGKEKAHQVARRIAPRVIFSGWVVHGILEVRPYGDDIEVKFVIRWQEREPGHNYTRTRRIMIGEKIDKPSMVLDYDSTIVL